MTQARVMTGGRRELAEVLRGKSQLDGFEPNLEAVPEEPQRWLVLEPGQFTQIVSLDKLEHGELDIFYRNMSPRRRALIDLLGVLLFLLPLCGFLAWMAWDFAATSWMIKESSREPGGLAYPMIPLLKSVVVIMPVLVALQGLSLLMRSLAALRSR